jgi:predicted RNA-binding protein YlxR (DUF448 family)/ribosomal protein L7Ae-like RNA K-turn-binding protein
MRRRPTPHTDRAARLSKARARTCVGCGERVEVRHSAREDDLVRLVQHGGEIAVDARGGALGRGAHVHARAACVEKAAARGLAKSFKARMDAVAVDGSSSPLTGANLAAAVRAALDRRIAGFLAAAAGAKALTAGADAVSGALARSEAHLVVVACDAAEAAELTEVRRAVASGNGVAWGSKAALGALADAGRSSEGVAVLAVLSEPLAGAIRRTVQAAAACDGTMRFDRPGGPRGSGARGKDDATKSADDRPSRLPYAERGA